jgi:hypothetical protein
MRNTGGGRRNDQRNRAMLCYEVYFLKKKIDLTSDNLRESADWCHGGHASADYALGTTYLGREARYLLNPNLGLF